MHRLLFVCVGLTALVSDSAQAQRPIPEPLQEGTPVVLVGQVSSTPGLLGERKMQIEVGETRRDYTVHFRDAVIKGPEGQDWGKGDLNHGQWVRAEGHVMNDPRRVWAERLRVITEEEARSIRNTAFYRPGYPFGYVAVMDAVYYERHYGRQFAESVYGPSEGRYASGNGYYRNGTYANGYVYRNGTYRNGTAANGTYRNGTYTNGTRNGTYANGSRVAGSRTVYVAPRRRAAK